MVDGTALRVRRGVGQINGEGRVLVGGASQGGCGSSEAEEAYPMPTCSLIAVTVDLISIVPLAHTSSPVDSSDPSRPSEVPSGQRQDGAGSNEPSKEGTGGGRGENVRSMLQMLASRAGIEITFPAEGEEEESSEGSEYEGESGEEEER